MKKIYSNKILFAMSVLCLSFLSSLVWANLANKETPTDKPPGFVPDPFESKNDYEDLLAKTRQKIEEANQTKNDLRKSIESQEIELGEIKEAKSALNEEISTTEDSIDAEEALSKTLSGRVQTLIDQVADKKNRLSDLLVMEDSLSIKFKDLETKIDLVDQETIEAQKTNDELQVVAQTPHTPGWHYLSDYGWLWSSPENYPMIYSDQLQGWAFYERGSNSPWLYYDYNSESWQAWSFE